MLGQIPVPAQSSSSFPVIFDEKAAASDTSYLSETFYLDRENENLPFVGLSAYCLDRSVQINLHYRTLNDKQWSDWVAFHPFTEGSLPDRIAWEAPPVRQRMEAIQFRSDRPVSEKIIFRLFFPPAKKKTNDEPGDRPAPRRSSASATGMNRNTIIPQYRNTDISTCNCPQPPVCDRACWCPSGACPPDPTPVSTVPTHIIVHHSAGFNSSDNFPAVVAYYWDLHVNTNGWDDIGYNWLIDADGVVYEGRGDNRLGAHFSCMNTNTVGICLIGNFQNLAPSAAALTQLRNWLAWESCNKDIELTVASEHAPSQLTLRHVSGHRDANPSPAPNSCAVGTACPGELLYVQLDAIATEAASAPCLNAEPDLVIQDMWTEPAGPWAGDTVQLYVSFKNVGAAPAPAVRWDYRIDGMNVGADTLAMLAAGATRAKSFGPYIFPAEGVFEYCIYADAVPGEPNGANNSFCIDVSVGGTTAVNETAFIGHFAMYPNPTAGRLRLEVHYRKRPEYCILQVVNALGQALYVRKEYPPSDKLEVELDLQALPAGTYYLQIHSNQGPVVRRFIRQGK